MVVWLAVDWQNLAGLVLLAWTAGLIALDERHRGH
jgi:hypothetical protein